MKDKTLEVVPDRVRLTQEYEAALRRKRILYLSADFGFGKTASILLWLQNANKPYSYATAADEDFFDQITANEFKKNRILVLDDLYAIQDEEKQAFLVEYLSATKAKVVLINRVELPPYLKAFWVTGQITCMDAADLRFTADETQELLVREGFSVSRDTAVQITKDTDGTALGIILVARRMTDGGYTKQVRETVRKDFCDCLDFAVYGKLTDEQRMMLLDLVTVERFDVELAIALTGFIDIERQIEKLCACNNILKRDGNEYAFSQPGLRDFFLKKQKQKFSKDRILELFRKAAHYYEQRGMVLEALNGYSEAGSKDRLLHLLIENTKKDAVSANFYETGKYYLELTDDEIRKSPELMYGMCMMQSISLKPEESERWYGELQQFLSGIDKTDHRYKDTKDKLLYLDIALPHRGADGVKEMVLKLATLMLKDDILVHNVSPTGNMPSLMHGGKDLCRWSKEDRVLGLIMKKPIERVLGDKGIGIAEAGLAESLFEKRTDLNFTEPLAYLNKALFLIDQGGTIQMRFATVGIMSRIFTASGNLDSALSMICSFREQAALSAEPTLMQNVDAWISWLSLYSGNEKASKEWLTDLKGDEHSQFFTTLRLCYQVKARIYILHEDYLRALSLLNRLKLYDQSYHREYGYYQICILQAIVHYRMQDNVWKEELTEALRWCEEFRFFRILADEGIALLELLEKLEYDGDEDFCKTLLKLTRAQAVNYPLYLIKEQSMEEQLTETEKTVLKLMTQGLTNQKIAEIMGVTLRTVKFHTGNIYSKMGVKNRAGAIAKGNYL